MLAEIDRRWYKLNKVDWSWHKWIEVHRGWRRLTEVDQGWLRLTDVDWGWMRLNGIKEDWLSLNKVFLARCQAASGPGTFCINLKYSLNRQVYKHHSNKSLQFCYCQTKVHVSWFMAGAGRLDGIVARSLMLKRSHAGEGVLLTRWCLVGEIRIVGGYPAEVVVAFSHGRYSSGLVTCWIHI